MLNFRIPRAARGPGWQVDDFLPPELLRSPLEDIRLSTTRVGSIRLWVTRRLQHRTPIVGSRGKPPVLVLRVQALST